MLNKRYENDGVPVRDLNAIQMKIKLQIDRKVKEGIYQFDPPPCPVCDENDFKLLSKKDRYGLYMPVVICKDCGLIQTNPRMNQDAFNKFYNVEYRKLYVGKESPTEDYFRKQYRKGSRIFEYLEVNDLLRNPENLFVFEVGCGAGGILQYFREKGCHVKGIDLGESYINFGKKQYDLDLSVGTVKTIKLDKAPDLIIYSHVLEHILTPNDELKKVHNILSDTGILYIEIPGVKNLMFSYNRDFLRLLQNAHVYHFTLRSLKNLLQKNGFNLVVGNEKVNSVFVKAQNSKSTVKIDSDYKDVMAYLHKIEKIRRRSKYSPKSLLVHFLKAIGLFYTVRNVYHKYTIS